MEGGYPDLRSPGRLPVVPQGPDGAEVWESGNLGSDFAAEIPEAHREKIAFPRSYPSNKGIKTKFGK